MTDLMELASRVKAAEKPDRELDAAIWLHLPEQEGHAWKHGGDRYKHAHQIAGCSFVPAYTGSLDAAMSLLPGDEPWDIGREGRETYFADLTCFYPGDVQDEPDASKVPYATAWTPALALTAACLIARAHQGTAHVEQ